MLILLFGDKCSEDSCNLKMRHNVWRIFKIFVKEKKKGEINGFEINRENEDINLINEDLKSSKIDCYQLNVLSCVEVVDMKICSKFLFCFIPQLSRSHFIKSLKRHTS